MSKVIEFETVGNEENIMRIGGMSFLPESMEWPVNPNGEKMVLILNIPTNFLNDKLAYNYPKDMMISVFTTYNLEDYFLDSIVCIFRLNGTASPRQRKGCPLQTGSLLLVNSGYACSFHSVQGGTPYE